MSYKTSWFSKRDLERLCRSVANLFGIELTADTLCDVIDGHATEGGYGANVERKLVREGVSLTDAEILLSDLADSEIDDAEDKKIKVHYTGGESRKYSGEAVDYMLAEVDGVELYAEADPVEGDETGNYDALRVEIMRQAVEHGIDLTTLEFWYDDQARHLTTRQAAEVLGISETRIRQLCQEGRMGKRVGRDWLITPEDIERNRVRKPGRPPGRIVTQDNAEDIRAEVGFIDLAAEIQVGRRVSVHRFTHEGGQSGCLLVVHADKDGRVDRAGISFGGPGTWGDWDNDSQTVRLDDADAEGLAVVYDTQGRRVVE